MKISQQLFKNHRYPAEIIQYAVWLYFVFPLSFRDVELLLHQRGIIVSHEAIRSWCYKFGSHFAQQVRRKRRQATDKWHLDEIFVTINRRRYYLWRAVDSEGIHTFLQQITDGVMPDKIDGSAVKGLAAQKVLAAAIESVETESIVYINDELLRRP